MNEEASRVFISCGQKPDELETANRIGEVLTTLGFVPHIAAQVHSTKALRENIFEQLRETEYFLLVDFRRERIAPEHDKIPPASAEPIHRGSLFSQQELAIASFLDLNILAFQEKGVKSLDGLLGHLQVNVIPFSDRSTLPDLIRTKVIQEAWQNNWRNQLVLEQADDSAVRVPQSGGRTALFFHLEVTNRHQRVAAQNCYGYLRSVTNAATNEAIPFEAAERKWAGYMFPNVTIRPGSYRKFDGVWFDPADPLQPRFKAFTDWVGCIPNLQGPGSWHLEYEVLSDNVPGSTKKLRLDVEASRRIRFGRSFESIPHIQ
jgi:hypothetical protein